MAAVMTGLKIKLTGKRVNGAYIKITLNMLKQFGIKYVQFEENKYNIEKQRFRLEKYQIEPDMSGACYFYAMSLMIKKKVLVKNLHLNSMQGDIKFLYAFASSIIFKFSLCASIIFYLLTVFLYKCI